MFPAIITVLLLTRLAATLADDVACLRDFKSSVSDPETKLWSWTFSNVSTNNFLCGFVGVFCWHSHEDSVMSLSLPSASLSGSIPSALRHCSSITSLDLSDNNFSGPIPASLCTWLPYLVVLNLSSNSLSGPIPPQLSTCIYLNKLDLSSNLLSGSIPPSLSFLPRLQAYSNLVLPAFLAIRRSAAIQSLLSANMAQRRTSALLLILLRGLSDSFFL